MSGSTDTGRATSHEKLLRQKFGGLVEWPVPQIEPTVGPFDPAAFVSFDAARRDLVERCEERLRTFTDEQIELLLRRPTDDHQAIRKDWENFLSIEIRALKERTPPWFAGGFGHPDYTADFENWGKMPGLSVQETLCLSTGFEPVHFPKKSLDVMTKGGLPLVDQPMRFLLIRYEQLKRRFDPDVLDQVVRPKSLLEWASRVHFPLHPDFERLLRRYHLPESKEPDQRSSAIADKRETRKIAQLFTVLAIDWFGYDPAAKRSPIPKQIVDLAASKGVTVSEDTVRKYLRIGASQIRTDGEEE
jgi:hypothetical protein